MHRACNWTCNFAQGNWLGSVRGQFNLIVSNPPYIAAADHASGRLDLHEPLQALASGHDGLDDIRAIIRQAPAHLLPGGWLLLEHGYDQARSGARAAYTLRACTTCTVVGAIWPGWSAAAARGWGKPTRGGQPITSDISGFPALVEYT
jgi:HemK-like putative methylase